MDSLIKLENFALIPPFAELFQQGVIVTVLLSVFTVLIGFVLAVVLALMRLSNFHPFYFLGLTKDGHLRDGGILLALSRFNPLSFLATTYVEVLRSTPVIVQIMIVYLGVFSVIELPNFTFLGFIKFNRFFPGVVALGMNSGAYLCEIIRSGIQSVDGGQSEAARSLGMSQAQTLRFIILPQAVRNILPALGNEFIMMLKETSLASTFFLGDLMTSYSIVKGVTYLTLEPMTIVAIIYLCMTFPLSKIVERFEKKMASPNSYKAHSRKGKKRAQKLGIDQ